MSSNECNNLVEEEKRELDSVGDGNVFSKEDSQAKVLRLPELLFRILHLACNMDTCPESNLDLMDLRYIPCPDYDTVRACRLVSKEWNEAISIVFTDAEKSVLLVNPLLHIQNQIRKTGQIANHEQYEPQALFEALKIPLVRPEALLPKNSDLPFPPFKLHLPREFFNQEIENTFIHSAWCHFERFLHEIDFHLPVDSNMKFDWPQMHLDNVKKINFICTTIRMDGFLVFPNFNTYNPFAYGNYMLLLQQILNSDINAKVFVLKCLHPNNAPGLFRMPHPKGIKVMDVPLVKMSSDEASECFEKNKNQESRLKSLVIRAPQQFAFDEKVDDIVTACHASYLIKTHGSLLEHLDLNIAGNEYYGHIYWRHKSGYVYKPLKIDMSVSMKKLATLELHAGIWEINNLKNYQEQLPRLKNLKLTLITRACQIKELYQLRSETVEKLTLSFVQETPYVVLRGFADNLPCLKELDVVVKHLDPGLHLCFQKFYRLKKLIVEYDGCRSDEGNQALYSAITGIPGDKGLTNDDIPMLLATKLYDDNTSLRDLTDLEEFKLKVRNLETSDSSIDVAMMLRTTFLRMPKLKKVMLSERILTIEEDQKYFVRKENHNRLAIKWISTMPALA